MLGIELLQSAAEQRVWGVRKVDELAVVSRNFCCEHHLPHMIDRGCAEVFFDGIKKTSTPLRCHVSVAKDLFLLWEEGVGCDWVADKDIVVEVDEVFT